MPANSTSPGSSERLIEHVPRAQDESSPSSEAADVRPRDRPGRVVRELRQKIGVEKRIAFVSGNFNVVHPGHLRLLKFAAEAGDVLVVGVNADGAPGVTVPAAMRAEALRSLSMVAHTILLEEPAYELIARLRPDFVVKGKEHESRINAEQAVVDSYGGKLLFTSGEVQFASINLLQRDYFVANLSTIEKPAEFPSRHGFRIGELKRLLTGFAGARVLVVGDLIVDTYVDCEPLGLSREDPTVVVTPLDEKFFVGGAGIVAAHARGLGATVRFFTIGGRDKQADFASTELQRFGVESNILVDRTRPTTNKIRYRAQGKTLLRLNRLRRHSVDAELISDMVRGIERLMPETDLLLFSDFNYGCLPQSLVDTVVSMARSRRVMLAADSQASSQLADISRFKGMKLITPTEYEARLAVRDEESGLAILSERLRKAGQAENVLVTLGAEGLLIYAPENGEYRTDRLPAFNTAPKDVAGAGDCLFTCTALGLAVGADIWQSSYFGSLAAAYQVSRVGNLPISTGDLMGELDCSSE